MTPRNGLFVDANLLVLLVVGSVGRNLIAKHRRLQDFTSEDYDILRNLLERAGRLLVTPNTLTETSNLLAQHQDPERTRFFYTLGEIILATEEVTVPSAAAVKNSEFLRLGLTDASLLDVVTPDAPLVTVDHSLYIDAVTQNRGSAVNFTYLQQANAYRRQT